MDSFVRKQDRTFFPKPNYQLMQKLKPKIFYKKKNTHTQKEE